MNAQLIQIGAQKYPECQPCEVIVEISFLNRLVANTGYKNPSQEKWERPIEKIKSIYDRHCARGKQYSCSIRYNRLNQQLFESADITYRGYKIGITNVQVAKQKNRTKEQDHTYKPCYDDSVLINRESTRKVVAVFTIKGNPTAWAEKKHAQWTAAPNGEYQGKWSATQDRKGNLLISGQYRRKIGSRLLSYHAEIKDGKYQVVMECIDTAYQAMEYTAKHKVLDPTGNKFVTGINIGKFRFEAIKAMEKQGYTPSNDTNKKFKTWLDPKGHLAVRATWVKAWQEKKKGHLYNHYNTEVWTTDTLERTQQTYPNYRPTNARGEQVRTHLQDHDTYESDWIYQRGRREVDFINREAEITNRMLNKIQQTINWQLELEYLRNENKKHKLSKPENKKKLWLSKIEKEQPRFLQATNWSYMLAHALELLEKDIWTQTEATKFCQENAKY